ncbi:MAG: gliding motility-associated C-terminal domain-containing protein, partial [Saprospiraceae bacterium]|nr:gliding motility-associated C-terminal domain-containing protein [Saprospiraceae bacterium]
NPAGVQTLNNAAVTGCDSTLFIQLYFHNTKTDTIKKNLVTGEFAEINGVIFNENNIQGITIYPDLSPDGCLQYAYVIVNFTPETITAEILKEDESCPNQNDGKIIINNISGCSQYNVSLNNIRYNIISFPWTLENVTPGDYNLIITGNPGCVYERTISVAPSSATKYTFSDSIFIVNEGENTTLDLHISPEPASVFWKQDSLLSCNDCLQPIVKLPTEDDALELWLTDKNGCVYEKIIYLRVLKKQIEIVIPNIFSPNQDGQNDEFELTSVGSKVLKSLKIYDRWGSLMYSGANASSNEKLSWNGTKDGQALNPGVYIYVAEYIDSEGKAVVISGDITLIL